MILDYEMAQLLQAQHVLGTIFSIYGDGALNKRVLPSSIRSAAWDLTCQRCGDQSTILLKSWRSIDGGEIWEDNGDPVPPEFQETIWVCLRCDNEMMNGGMSIEDPGDIADRREIEDYENDPINEPCPWGEGQ